MYVSEAKEFIKRIAENKIKISVMMHGSMGIGKSWLVKQIGEELGYDSDTEIVDLRLAQMEPADLIGIPRSRDGRTVWDRPEWLPDAEKHPRGILFLDELNRAPQDVRQAVFQLVNEWKLHTHSLPDGWSIVSAINPENSTLNYQVEALDPAMLRRFVNIKVSPDRDTWLKWATGEGNIDKTLTGFISSHGELLFSKDDFKVEGNPSPDQYRMIDTLLKAGIVEPRHQMEIFTGLIGVNAATSLVRFIDRNYSRPASGQDVIERYSGDKALRKKVKDQNKKADEMHSTITELVAELDNRKPSKKGLENLVEFIEDVSAEHKATVVHKMPKPWLHELISNSKVTKVIAQIMKQAKS